jgi:hypothetical protein
MTTHTFIARTAILLSLATALLLPTGAKAASLDVSASAPRAVEERTSVAVERDYTQAWKSLVSALQTNRAELLEADFTGAAREHWQKAIVGQRENGLSRRIVDRGHSLHITFYSPDGSAMQGIDTADLEIQYLDGSNVLGAEHVTARYLVLLTPAEDSWKVRGMEELPAR